jgi:hypothetical protein
MVDATAVLQDAYDRVAESVPDLLTELSAADAAERLDGRSNSIAWLVWHTTRMMDAQVAPLAGRGQAHAAFAARLGVDLPESDTGYGHDDDEVDRVGAVDLAALAEYHAAVQAVVRDLLSAAPDLDAVVDPGWDPPVTMAARLVSVVDDAARHVGQAEYLRGVLARRG